MIASFVAYPGVGPVTGILAPVRLESTVLGIAVTLAACALVLWAGRERRMRRRPRGSGCLNRLHARSILERRGRLVRHAA
jgi:hypothetical protein